MKKMIKKLYQIFIEPLDIEYLPIKKSTKIIWIIDICLLLLSFILGLLLILVGVFTIITHMLIIENLAMYVLIVFFITYFCFFALLTIAIILTRKDFNNTRD